MQWDQRGQTHGRRCNGYSYEVFSYQNIFLVIANASLRAYPTSLASRETTSSGQVAAIRVAILRSSK